MCEAQGEHPCIGWEQRWQAARTRDDEEDAGELGLLKGNWVLFFSLPEGICPPSTFFPVCLPSVLFPFFFKKLILLVIYILNVALLPGPPSDRIPTRRHLSSLLHLVSTWLSIPSPTLARQGRPLPHVCQGFRPMFAFWLVALEAPRVPGSLTLLIFLWGYYLLKSIQYFP